RSLPTQYGFDPVGNLTSIKDPRLNITSYAFDSLRRLQTVTAPLGAVTAYCYDEDSERTFAAKARISAATAFNCNAPDASQWQIEQYAYNSDGTLARVTDPELHVTTYTYDALSRRTIVTDPDQRSTATAYDLAGQEICTFTGWSAAAAAPQAADC